MKILIDNGRMRSARTGLGQVAVQFAAALGRARAHDMDFLFLTHPAFGDFADIAADSGIAHVKGKFSLLDKIRRLANKNVFPYYWDGNDHQARHALHRNHLVIPPSDKTPLVFTSHDMHFMSGDAGHIRRNLPRFLQTVKRADIVAFISEYSRRIAAEHADLGGKETCVIYNGVDKPQNPVRPQWFENTMRPFLFSVGQIETYKNYHCMPAVMNGLPEMNLILAGKFKTEATALLKDAIRREPSGGRVFLPGSIGEGEKAWLFRECSGFVFPSLREGFGMPIIEALHFGKPVFCFDNTALPEVGGEHVFYWQSDDPKAMAELVAQTLAAPTDDSAAAQRMQWASRFSWDNNAAAYIGIYRRLCAG